MRIDLFRMERMQSLHWRRVEYDLSESGVLPQKVVLARAVSKKTRAPLVCNPDNPTGLVLSEEDPA